jgi:hypothetical protein
VERMSALRSREGMRKRSTIQPTRKSPRVKK